MANLPSEGIAFNFTPPIKPALSTEECAYRKGQGQMLQPLSLLSCTPPPPAPGLEPVQVLKNPHPGFIIHS